CRAVADAAGVAEESLTRKFSLPEENSQSENACAQCELLRKAIGAGDTFCSERCAQAFNSKRRRDNSETNLIAVRVRPLLSRRLRWLVSSSTPSSKRSTARCGGTRSARWRT